MDSQQIMTNISIILITFIFAAFFVAAEFALVQTRITALEEAKKTSRSAGVKRASRSNGRSRWFLT